MAENETATAVRFDTVPVTEPEGRRFTAPLTTGLGIVTVEITNAGRWLGIEELRGSVGQRIRLNGPTATAGKLLSFEYDEAADTARLLIEKGGGDD